MKEEMVEEEGEGRSGRSRRWGARSIGGGGGGEGRSNLTEGR